MAKKTSRRRVPAALRSRRLLGGARPLCAACGAPTRALATRRGSDGNVYRERECEDESCLERFWTCEATADKVPRDVISRPESGRGVRARAGKL